MMPKTKLNQMVARAMTHLKASCNAGANKIVEQAEQEKATRENLNVLIDLATTTMVAEDTKPTEEKSRH